MDKYQKYRLKDLEGYRKRKREWAKTLEQREKRRLWQAAWREANREKYNAMAREYHRQRRTLPEYKARRDRYYMQTKYGITPDDYDRMLEQQGWVCAICGSPPPPSKRRLHIDHDHETGKVRGLLCTRCNTALGWFEKHNGRAAEYLAGIVW